MIADERLGRWLTAVVSTPGLTAIRDREAARQALLEDALRGVELVTLVDGPIVDVGSGGGTPGIPLAAALPDREVTLLEAERRKADFLHRWAREFPNVRAVWGRAEEQVGGPYRVAVAKALAPPPVAAEWCLPLVGIGGIAVLWAGPTADADRVGRVARHLGAVLEESPAGFFLLRKRSATPAGFPRRPGVARKRPLA